MTEIKYIICDHCNKEIDCHKALKSKINITYFIGALTRDRECDLCDQCTKKLNDFLNNKGCVI